MLVNEDAEQHLYYIVLQILFAIKWNTIGLKLNDQLNHRKNLGCTALYECHSLTLSGKNQTRTLTVEVEKGFMWTAVQHGSVDPKRYEKVLLKRMAMPSF